MDVFVTIFIAGLIVGFLLGIYYSDYFHSTDIKYSKFIDEQMKMVRENKIKTLDQFMKRYDEYIMKEK